MPNLKFSSIKSLKSSWNIFKKLISLKPDFFYTLNVLLMILLIFCKKVWVSMSNILRGKLIDKYDQREYKIISIYQTQTEY